MRLLKLAAYALFGYALYEFIRGMMNEAQAGGGGDRSFGGGNERRSEFSGAGAAQNITGPGQGQEVRTEEPDGGVMRHRVGRGVVR